MACGALRSIPHERTIDGQVVTVGASVELPAAQAGAVGA
jgi:hypothetical protein